MEARQIRVSSQTSGPYIIASLGHWSDLYRQCLTSPCHEWPDGSKTGSSTPNWSCKLDPMEHWYW